MSYCSSHAKLISAANAQADGEKKLEDAQGEALEALKKGNVEIVSGSEKK